MKTLFVSQTWLSRDHPDNNCNAKLQLLQSFLRQCGTRQIAPSYMAAFLYGPKLGIAAEELNELGFVWFDLFSVPQVDKASQESAIASIPDYVACSSFFLVLAGPWVHEDTGTVRDIRAWASRGWCRLEFTCNALSWRAKPLIVMQSSSDVATHGPGGIIGREWFACPVGLGQFSVESDLHKLGPVIDALIDKRMARKRREGTDDSIRWSRFLHAMKAHLLQGAGVEPADEESSPDRSDNVAPGVVKPHRDADCKAWMAKLGFTSAFEQDSHGWCPLFYAVIEGRVDVARWLLDAGAAVESTLCQSDPSINGVQGWSVLMAAAFFRPSNAPIIRLLLSRGADPMRLDAAGHTSLHVACIGGYADNIDALLQAAPQALDARNMFGTRPLVQFVMFGHSGALAWCLKHGRNLGEYLLDAKTGCECFRIPTRAPCFHPSLSTAC